MNTMVNNLFVEKVVRNEKGSVIIVSLLVAVLFVLLSGGYFNLLAVEASNTARTFRSNLALHLAESGVEEAIWEIKYHSGAFLSTDGWTGTDPKIKTTALTTALGENVGTYKTTVTNPTSSTPVIEGVGQALYQTATLAESRTVEVSLLVTTSPIFDMAVFADETIEIDQNACTDSFDSSLGPYDEDTNSGLNGDVGTNSTETDPSAIDLDQNSSVEGDTYVGVDGDPIEGVDFANQNINFTGDQYALDEAVIIPSVFGPTGLTNYGNVDYNDGSFTISSSGQYTNLNFGTNGETTVTIDGGTQGAPLQLYITGAFHLNSNATLNIGSTSYVEIYADGSIMSDSNSWINNNTQNPAQLQFFGTNIMVDYMDGNKLISGITFNSNGDIYATILAPNSTVELDSNAQLFGAVMADDIIINSNSCIHYDENLGSEDGPEQETASVSMWQEIYSL